MEKSLIESMPETFLQVCFREVIERCSYLTEEASISIFLPEKNDMDIAPAHISFADKSFSNFSISSIEHSKYL